MVEFTVAVVAWPRSLARLEYLRRTLSSLKRLLLVPTGSPQLVSAEEDQVPAALRLATEDLCRAQGFGLIWHPAPAQLGRHMNWLVHTQLPQQFFIAQDDFELRCPLELAAGLDILASGDGQYVRYVCHDDLNSLHEDPRYPGFVRLPPHWEYPFGNPQYLADRRFFTQLGPWREKGGQEKDMTRRVRESGLPVWVCRHRSFVHIGRESVMGHRCPAFD